MTSYLIVNADDFGYAPGINQGIIESASRGILTATGVLANCADFERQLNVLQASDQLDIGVHLNLTHGDPLTSEMRALMRKWKGQFPDILILIRQLALKRINLATVEREWRAQIERCIANGSKVRFLNSHQHIHMLPGLFPMVVRLARDYSIPHIRVVVGEWQIRIKIGPVLKNLVMEIMGRCAPSEYRTKSPVMLGLAQSGQLDQSYLEKTLPSLKPNKVYELMCHPGHYRPGEIVDPALLRYHNWDQERELLCSEDIKRLCQMHSVQLIGYRHLEILDDRLTVAPPATFD